MTTDRTGAVCQAPHGDDIATCDHGGFDTHHGRFDGPAAVLGERWVNEGDYGDYQTDAPDESGSGDNLFLLDTPAMRQQNGGFPGHRLHLREIQQLAEDHGMGWDDLDRFQDELLKAKSLLVTFDSQGFVSGQLLDEDMTTEAIAAIEAINRA